MYKQVDIREKIKTIPCSGRESYQQATRGDHERQEEEKMVQEVETTQEEGKMVQEVETMQEEGYPGRRKRRRNARLRRQRVDEQVQVRQLNEKTGSSTSRSKTQKSSLTSEAAVSTRGSP